MIDKLENLHYERVAKDSLWSCTGQVDEKNRSYGTVNGIGETRDKALENFLEVSAEIRKVLQQ